MDYGRTLPLTGAGVFVGGAFIVPWQVAAIAVAMIAVGAVIVRLTFRRGRKAGQA